VLTYVRTLRTTLLLTPQNPSRRSIPIPSVAGLDPAIQLLAAACYNLRENQEYVDENS